MGTLNLWDLIKAPNCESVELPQLLADFSEIAGANGLSSRHSDISAVYGSIQR